MLSPSASERAAKFGETPAFYVALFPNHSACEIKKREEGTRELMARIRAAHDARPKIVYQFC